MSKKKNSFWYEFLDLHLITVLLDILIIMIETRMCIKILKKKKPLF